MTADRTVGPEREKNTMPDMLKSHIALWIILLGILAAPGGKAGTLDNQLTEQEKKQGWILLFDGKSTEGWMTSGWEACPEVLDQGTINPAKCPKLGSGGWDMVYEQPWTDFILEVDFKISPQTNSGVMVRNGR